VEENHRNIKITNKQKAISPELQIFKGIFKQETAENPIYIICGLKDESSSTLLFYKVLNG
jgi:hypothetical protein